MKPQKQEQWPRQGGQEGGFLGLSVPGQALHLYQQAPLARRGQGASTSCEKFWKDLMLSSCNSSLYEMVTVAWKQSKNCGHAPEAPGTSVTTSPQPQGCWASALPRPLRTCGAWQSPIEHLPSLWNTAHPPSAGLLVSLKVAFCKKKSICFGIHWTPFLPLSKPPFSVFSVFLKEFKKMLLLIKDPERDFPGGPSG